MENKFHKWCHHAVVALGLLCLWNEIANLFDKYFNAMSAGMVIGMIFIGWAMTYEYEKKD